MEQVLEYELTAYIPVGRWEDIVHLLPSGYTKQRADGYWEGEQEDIVILTVFGDYSSLGRLESALVRTLITAGEQAVLIKMGAVKASIYSR